MGAHSILPPSSANEWVNCTGWLKMTQEFPELPSETGDEGDAVHEAGAALLTGKPVKIGDEMSNGLILDSEMFEAAKLYKKRIVDTLNIESRNSPGPFGIEQRIACPDVHPEIFGTPDFWHYDRANGILYIFDLKYGFLPVDAFQNWQLICYFSGLRTALNLPDNTRVHFHIIQPRAFRRGPDIMDVWRTTAGALNNHVEGLKNAAVLNINRQDLAKLNSGPHCRFCSARFACESAIKAGIGLYESVNSVILSAPSPASLSTMMTLLTEAEARIKSLKAGVEEQIIHAIKSGEAAPGYSIKPSTGRLAWNKSTDEVIKIGKLFGADLSKPGTLTPVQSIKAGVPEQIIESFCSRPNKGFKLVRDSEQAIRRIFA